MNSDFGFIIATVQLFMIPVLFTALLICAWNLKG